LANLAVGVFDYMAGAGIDANQSGHLDMYPGFLFDFTDGGVDDRLA
jgi:hypothetical protein